MGDAGSYRDSRLGPAATLALADDDLAIFVLNVGDGDSIVIRFPVLGTQRSYAIVDSNDAPKTVALVKALQEANAVVPADPGEPAIRFMCATHPHLDHISGLKAVLDTFGAVEEFWDSGFRFTSLTYQRLISAVEKRAGDGLRFVRPTSGYEMFHGAVRVTVLSPSIALRNRYDSYGVDVNNASIVLRVTYPVDAPSTDYPANAPAAGAASPQTARPRTAILGGDAQTDAWGKVLEEFPHFDADATNWKRQIQVATGSQPLACDLLKVSHHASKRGVNLELLERLGDTTGKGPSDGPRYLVASCSSLRPDGYGFPHPVTQELLREVRDPTSESGKTHQPDDELGIHYTSQILDPGDTPVGSVAFVAGADRSAALYRFGDGESDEVDLTHARRVR